MIPQSEKQPVPTGDRNWLDEGERGSSIGIRLLAFLAKALGRRQVHLILRVVSLYFLLFATTARRASREYHERLGQPWNLRVGWRHLYRFSQVALDRMYALSGSFEGLQIERDGSHRIEALLERGCGGILLGAHLGSFEVMRAIAQRVDFRVNVLMHTENARRITRFLESVGDASDRLRIIEITPGEPTYILRVQEVIEAGELVAILGDRCGLNERSTEVEFVGGPAHFPTGPYVLAQVLKCPVLLVYGLFYAPDRYSLHCEEFAERIELPRREREQALKKWAQRYAERLEHYCRRAPDNWFNFFDFWSQGGASGEDLKASSGKD